MGDFGLNTKVKLFFISSVVLIYIRVSTNKKEVNLYYAI
jgi:hypothetical protein